MKSCSLNDFMQELEPWLDNDHIKEAFIDDGGHLTLLFTDGMKNVYGIDDCNKTQVEAVLQDLKDKGIPVTF
ncbi:MAG: cell division protein FtsQ [Desulfobulbaceae bacterium]|nr:cell division protein FtsQ [Desulfobulbaceae bacterium]